MSKKEERQKIKEEKQAAAKRKEKFTALVVKAAIVILVPMALFVFYQGLFTGPPSLPPDLIGEADHVKGSADSDVVVTMYADFECPACMTEFQLIARTWPRIRDDVKLVFRHFPLDTHRFSFQASRYAEAAGRQGRFWEMHDLLFANQQAWSPMNDPAPLFEEYAAQLGLDIDQLRADVELPEVRAKIVADQQGGIRAGVRSTPSLFINGRLVGNPQSSAALIELVNEAKASG